MLENKESLKALIMFQQTPTSHVGCATHRNLSCLWETTFVLSPTPYDCFGFSNLHQRVAVTETTQRAQTVSKTLPYNMSMKAASLR